MPVRSVAIVDRGARCSPCSTTEDHTFHRRSCRTPADARALEASRRHSCRLRHNVYMLVGSDLHEWPAHDWDTGAGDASFGAERGRESASADIFVSSPLVTTHPCRLRSCPP